MVRKLMRKKHISFFKMVEIKKANWDIFQVSKLWGRK